MNDNIYKEIAEGYYGKTTKCIVKGCTNHSNEGKFVGSLCMPCYHMLNTGEITPSNAWFAEEINNLKRYKDTLEDAGVVSWSLTTSNANDPSQLLNDIIQFHIDIALDPHVNGGFVLVKADDPLVTMQDWIVDEDNKQDPQRELPL